ncbi:MAG: hypothetical protein WCO52_01260 [bacterium]
MRLPSLPNRVSRLYPIFSLILAINCSILLYAWQVDQIKLASYATVDQQEQAMRDQIEKLQSDLRQDKSQLSLQTTKVDQVTKQLTDIQKQQDAKSAQLSTSQAQLKSQQDQLSKNADELTQLRARPPLFSFQNTSHISNVSAKEAEVKQVVSDAYDYIQKTYGQPYLLNSIVITFVDEFSIPGSSGEIIIENSSTGIKVNIHLKDFDKTNFEDTNTLIHEMVHGFHGVAVFQSSALEEGMTVATTDAVMEQMTQDGKLPHFSHLYLAGTADQYKNWNATLHVPKDNQALYESPQVSEIYQLIGMAWWQLYENDPTVFKNINAAYYPKVQKGILPDSGVVLDAIRSSIKTVNGQPVDAYLSANRAFNPN